MRATSNGRRLPPERGNFNNPDVLVRSWYPVARSREVEKGSVRSFDLANRRVVLYRNGAGAIRALDARCPHLGADLGHGSVVGDGVRCAFHGWPSTAGLPRRADLALRATALMYTLLRDDDRILDGIRFHPGYTANDAGLETFARAVDAMEVW
jgi:hypothetical protein